MEVKEKKTKEIRIVIPEDLLFIPKKMIQHFLNVEKEILLTLRYLIDAKIEALERKKGK